MKRAVLPFYCLCFLLLTLLWVCIANAEINKESITDEIRRMQQYVVNVTTNSADKKATANKFKNWQAKNQNKGRQTLSYYESERSKLYESYEYLIGKLFSNIVTDKKLIDRTQALNTLENCDDTYCKLYKAYFLATTGRENEGKAIIDPLIANDKAKDELSCYFMHHLYGKYDPETEIKDFKNRIAYFIVKHSRCYINSNEERDTYGRIPYWLILEVPEILNFRSERFSAEIYVPAEKLIRSLPSYKKFRDVLNVIDGENFGTIMIDYYAMYASYIETISIAPELIELSTDFDHNHTLLPVSIWSYKGIWNRHKYLAFKKYADRIYLELADFYLKNNKAEYAPKAQQIIDKYIAFRYHGDRGIDRNLLNEKAFKIFTQHHNLDELKILTKDFNAHDYDVALKIAILNNYDVEAIKWLLNQGADVNFIHYCETILMSAVTRPEVIKLLLDNKAKVDTQNSFGKTALFYAIQFNNLESVKLLLEAGANVNHQLLSNDEIREHNSDIYTNINIVGNFTPLAYAKNYGSKELIDFLETAGAKLTVSEQDLQKWLELGK